MAGALVVSSGEKGRDMLSEVLAGMQIAPVSVLQNGAESRRAVAQEEYELIVINAPLTDEFGGELAMDAAQRTGAGVVLLVKAELADEVAGRVEDAGVFVVAKPLNRALLFGAIKLAGAAHRRLAGLQQQNDALQRKIEEIRLVDRAKCALIQYRQYTEPEAHKRIEKEAMDRRKSRREIAQDILLRLEGHL